MRRSREGVDDIVKSQVQKVTKWCPVNFRIIRVVIDLKENIFVIQIMHPPRILL